MSGELDWLKHDLEAESNSPYISWSEIPGDPFVLGDNAKIEVWSAMADGRRLCFSMERNDDWVERFIPNVVVGKIIKIYIPNHADMPAGDYAVEIDHTSIAPKNFWFSGNLVGYNMYGVFSERQRLWQTRVQCHSMTS